jgi:[ribosomal protein S18]-alanine N-acetyltransferase
MRESDMDQIMEIENSSFSMPWSVSSFLAEIDKVFAIAKVAVTGDEIDGYICANLIADECHILNLAIKQKMRRRGIGTRLMKEAMTLAAARGCRFFYLEVRVSNAGARDFYERFGFRIAGVRRRYYVAPVEDAAVMMLRV